MNLRPYQQVLKDLIYSAWAAGNRNVLAQLPTGGGKTVLFSSILHEHNGASVTIVHRQELVNQIALALAREGVRHKILAPQNVVRMCVQEQLRKLGSSSFDPNARCTVAGVDTLMARKDQLGLWAQQVTLWVQDEAHHTLAGAYNKWGKAVDLFPNAKGLGVTATPLRSDGRGLGRRADGVMDVMVEGPSMRWLIDEGYLVDYVVHCPPNDIDLSKVDVSESTGDFSQPQLAKAVKESHIVGDVVVHYHRTAAGKRGLVFTPDVETAAQTAQAFRESGISAEVVSAKTPDSVRSEIIRRFDRGEIKVLTNCDIISEGFDIPAVDIVMFARPTESYGLFCQQFGRGTRPVYAPGYDLNTREGRLAAIAASSKPYLIVNDHAGNVIRHNGPPDFKRQWTLDARQKRARADRDDEIALKPCPLCTRPYMRVLPKCPYCDYMPEPALRSKPEFVDGDLVLLDPATLAEMRRAVEGIDAPAEVVAQSMMRAGAPQVAIHSYMKQHKLRQDAQAALRESISWWAGWQRARGRSDQECYRRFFLAFGLDIMSAQTLGRPEAMVLADKINKYIGDHRYE